MIHLLFDLLPMRKIKTHTNKAFELQNMPQHLKLAYISPPTPSKKTKTHKIEALGLQNVHQQSNINMHLTFEIKSKKSNKHK